MSNLRHSPYFRLRNGRQSGFITMIVVIVLIIAAVIFVAYKRVLSVQQ